VCGELQPGPGEVDTSRPLGPNQRTCDAVHRSFTKARFNASEDILDRLERVSRRT
jgi:hypothetical protein